MKSSAKFHEHHRRGDFLELRRRIVIPRSVDSIQQIVGIKARRDPRHGLLEEFISIISRGQSFLHLRWRAPGK